MKRLTPSLISGFCLFFLLTCCSIALHAETQIRTVVTETTTTSWYSSPWIWIGAAIIAILGLSVLMGSGRRPSDGDY